MCFRREFLRNMWPIQLAFLRFTTLECSALPRLYVILPHFSQGRSNLCSPSFSNSLIENFTSISILSFEVSKFQHHTMLCSRCSTSLVSSLKISSICWWEVFLDLISCVCLASFVASSSSLAQQLNSGQGHLLCEVSASHAMTHPLDEGSARRRDLWQHTTLTRDGPLCLHR